VPPAPIPPCALRRNSGTLHGAHTRGQRWSRRIFLAAGVRQRHPAFDPSKEDISSYSTGERMARYVDEAVPLGREAVEGALDAAA